MSGTTPETTAMLLASTKTGSDGAGLIAFVIVAALFIACWFLYRSMRNQLGRIDVTRSAGSGIDVERDDSGGEVQRETRLTDGDVPSN